MSEKAENDRLLLVGERVSHLAKNGMRHGHDVFAVCAHKTAELASFSDFSAVCSRGEEPVDMVVLASSALQKECKNIIYAGGFENNIPALKMLENDLRLYGCSPAVVRKLRNNKSLTRAGRAWGFDVVDPAEDANAETILKTTYGEYLYSAGKRVGNGGRKGMPSVAMVLSDGSEAFVLGTAALINGSGAAHSAGYRFEGAIYPHPFINEIEKQLANIADSLTLEFDIKGLWAFNFIFDGAVILTEVIPRPSYWLSLIDDSTMNDLLGLHIESITKRYSTIIVDPGPTGIYFARAMIFSEEPVTCAGSARWIEADCLDISMDGELVPAGEPLLTIGDKGADYNGLIGQIHKTAEEITSFQTSRAAILP
jgi:predicted ATP-grasp superfamily ATP-dependent carboligase